VSRLLVRDLAQVATPAGATAPLRGAALREVDVVEDAYVLVHDGTIEAVGRMGDLGSLGEEVEELGHGGRRAAGAEGVHAGVADGAAQLAVTTGTDKATYTRERPGLSAFVLEDGTVYHTYSTYGRGLDILWGAYQWLDRAPLGRNERDDASWHRRDQYED